MVLSGIPKLVISAESRSVSLEGEHYQSKLKKTPANTVPIKLELREYGELKLIFIIVPFYFSNLAMHFKFFFFFFLFIYVFEISNLQSKLQGK